MGSVDNRVVKMEFDNANFERRMGTTLASLQRLQQNLDFQGASRGMRDLQQVSRGFNLNSMSSAVEGVSAKFIALTTIAVTALSNITNRAVDAGIRVVKSLSLDQVTSGFQEYETNMKSIQTILANTKADGTNLGQVNDALDELNEYADQTIYNFAEMARNIGTFTAAGVDLDTSTTAIKGIANAAAISGSTSQQASTAMYQLSQAIASGSLKLMDWNSVVNAGMGGEVMQKALFDTGKAMGTLVNVPLDQTFDEWKDAGNTFRDSLQEGWITTDVLTTTLAGFSGEVTDAELAAKGFSEEMIAEFKELGETGIEAATKVRTFTQLMDTAQEAVGSGWSQTFRIVLGDFEEATELFTGISEAFGSFADSSAEARNELLQGWKDLGGRTILIESLGDAATSLGYVFDTLKESFRSVFPKKGSADLLQMTKRFQYFILNLRPTEAQLDKLGRAFTGIFNIIKVAKEIFVGIISVIRVFTRSLTRGGPGILEYAARFGDLLTSVKEYLIEGEGLLRFFDKLKDGARALAGFLREPIPYLEDLRDNIIDFVRNFSFDDIDIEIPDFLAKALENLQNRFEALRKLGSFLGDIWEPVKERLKGVWDVLNEITQGLKDWFADLGSDMADAAEPGDFDAVVDVLNLGLLGGIAGLLAKFAKDGINFDFGNGFFEKASDALEELTGVLSAMQADIKANAILKIAGAVAILAVSVTLLAAIDPEALAKSLTALAVGFGQLIGAFAIINKIAFGPQSAASFAALATGLIILAGALLVLSVAVKILSTMSWEELSKGMLSITGLIIVLTQAVKPLSANSGGMIRAGIGLTFLAVSMNLLAIAMKIFATMSWEEMGKGLTAVAGSLLIIAGTMQLMPKNLAVQSLGILGIAVALNILGAAVRIFSLFDWEELGKGFAGIAGGLLGIAVAMQLMPKNLPVQAAGLLLISGALLVIAEAMRQIAQLDWEDLAKGLVGIGGAMIVLAIGAHAMNGALLGAIAMGVMSTALLALSNAMETIGSMSVLDILKALVGIAGAFIIIGVAGAALSPVIPSLFALGAALTLLGAGFALFGAGVNLIGRGLRQIARAGKAGIGVVIFFIDQLIKRIPALVVAFAQGLVAIASTLLAAAPVLIEQFGVVLVQLFDTLITLIPKFGETIKTLVTELIGVLREVVPDFIALGFEILLAFLSGLRDNIGEITTLVADIVVNFFDSLSAKVDEIIDSVTNFVISVIKGVVNKLKDIAKYLVPKGKELIGGFLSGVVEKGGDILTWFTELPGNILGWIGDLIEFLFEKGVNLITGFLTGITDKAVDLLEWFTGLPGDILGWIGDLSEWLSTKGKQLLVGMLTGLNNKVGDIQSFVAGLPGDILGWIGDTSRKLITKGWNLLVGLKNGMVNYINESFIPWVSGLPGKIVTWIGDVATQLGIVGRNVVIGIWNGMVDRTTWIVNKVSGWIKSVIPGPIRRALGMKSPSKLMATYGGYIAEGLAIGVEANGGRVATASEGLAKKLVDSFSPDISALESTMSRLAETITAIEDDLDTSPVITPVLNLDDVKDMAQGLDDILGGQQLALAGVTATATNIAATEEPVNVDSGEAGSNYNHFEQHNYSPEALSTLDIYRNTKSQFALALEELDES